MKIELHLLQNFAPSNLNRDDSNNPKDCDFGGVRRARISSQCMKRAIRFDPAFSEATRVPPSDRSRLIITRLAGALQEKGLPFEDALNKASEFARYYSSKKGTLDAKNKLQTLVLLFISKEDIENITRLLLEVKSIVEVKEVAENYAKTHQYKTSAPDIAMFGRMLADRPETNLDAACQVAHAISTHKVNMEFDFFTAVDDLQKQSDSGAGMMGVIGYNSACFYRYACIDYEQLVKNLDADHEMANKSVEGFLRASVSAIPTGKQNSFAANNPPSFMMAVAREDNASWSLANAFEKPVTAYENSLLGNSIKALDSYWGKLASFYGEPEKIVVGGVDAEPYLDVLKPYMVSPFETWINNIIDHLPRG